MTDPALSYRGYRFPRDVISHAVWLDYRFSLSFRDVEVFLAQRGVVVSWETIRQWCEKFGPDYAAELKRRRGRLGDTWNLDKVFVTDKLRSYSAAHRRVMPSVIHNTKQYANNRAEVSYQPTHQPTRQRERQIRGFRWDSAVPSGSRPRG